MDILFLILIFLILLVGFLRQLFILSKTKNESVFINEFISELKVWTESREHESDEYELLTRRSDRIESLLEKKIAGTGEGESTGKKSRERVVIPEALKEINNARSSRLNDIQKHYFSNIAESLVQETISNLNRLSEWFVNKIPVEKKRCINPLWFLYAFVSWLLGASLIFLPKAKREKIIAGRLFSFVAGLAVLIGIISGVMYIVIEWDNFIKIIQK